MNRINSILVGALVTLIFTWTARAQETNSYPDSNLEIFEATTGTVIIRSVEDIASVPGKAGGLTVKCREAREPGTNRREFGVSIIVTPGQGVEVATVVDYDELDALIRATDYVSKVDWSITSLNHFEAGYTTRSGLRVASYSSSRSGLIEAFVSSNRLLRSRTSLSIDQLVRFRVALEQAKAKIEVLQKEK